MNHKVFSLLILNNFRFKAAVKTSLVELKLFILRGRRIAHALWRSLSSQIEMQFLEFDE